jgi:hypothetical protein
MAQAYQRSRYASASDDSSFLTDARGADNKLGPFR